MEIGGGGLPENISFQLCQLTSPPFCPFDREDVGEEVEDDDVDDLLPLAVVLLQDVVDLDATMLVGIFTSERNSTLLVVELKTRMLHCNSWRTLFKTCFGSYEIKCKWKINLG